MENQMELLHRSLGATQRDIQTLQATQQDYIQKLLNEIPDEAQAAVLSALSQDILNRRTGLAGKHMAVVERLEALLGAVVGGELESWRRNQQLSRNGRPFSNNLDVIAKWCELLAERVRVCGEQASRVSALCKEVLIPVSASYTKLSQDIHRRVYLLLQNLVQRTFIVEEQPPKIVQQSSPFTVTVRALIGEKFNVHRSPPKVTAAILSEAQVGAVCKNEGKAVDMSSGSLEYESPRLDYHRSTGKLAATFPKMKLLAAKRDDKQKGQNVTDLKYCLVFQAELNIGGLKFLGRAMSLPIIATVQSSQRRDGLATILWDNQFSKPGRQLFDVPESVTWPELAVMLKTWCMRETGRELSESHLEYLANKIPSDAQDGSANHVVSWKQFAKDSLPNRKFSFWEWFDGVIRLIKDHLQGPWKDGLVHGFIGEKESHEMLMRKPVGTFMIRFTESQKSAATISFKRISDNMGLLSEEVVKIRIPSSDLSPTVTIPKKIIETWHSLLSLYPEIPKELAFGKYNSTENESQKFGTDGYVMAEAAEVAPNLSPTVPTATNFDYLNSPPNVLYRRSDSSASTHDVTMMQHMDDSEFLPLPGAMADHNQPTTLGMPYWTPNPSTVHFMQPSTESQMDASGYPDFEIVDEVIEDDLNAQVQKTDT